MTEQIFFVMEGLGTLRIGQNGEEKFEVSPGDVVRIPINTWHSIIADQGGPLKYLAIDCFGGERNEDEPTWESHVKVVCKQQNWDFDQVKIDGLV